MEEQFYSIVTQIGKAKIANSNVLETKLNLSKFIVGDSNGTYYNPTEEQTKLKNKVWEGSINSITVDTTNKNWIVIQTVIPSDVGGFTIREVGILDNENNLIAVGKYPATYKPILKNGSSKDIILKFIMEISNTSNVELKVNPSTVIATRQDLESLKTNINTEIDNKLNNISNKQEVETIKEDVKTIKDATYSINNMAINNKTTLDKIINPNTTDITYYVNQIAVDDKGNGLSENTPFKTLEQAFDSIPVVCNCSYTIQIIGDYNINSDIWIGCKMDFKNMITLTSGQITSTNHSSLYLSQITSTCMKNINFDGAELVVENTNDFAIQNCTFENMRYAIAAYGAKGKVENCKFKNVSVNCIQSSNLSDVLSINNIGQGDRGLSADRGGVIIKVGTQPTGTTHNELLDTGGLIR